MTDEQIIKAMEYCCGNIKSDEECSEDMCYQVSLPEGRNGDIRWCRQWLIKDALDLINRRKEEIERLLKENIGLKYDLQVASEESLNWKSEAIKEFAERLKKYLCLDLREGISVVTIDNIDKIVKEMTEVQE